MLKLEWIVSLTSIALLAPPAACDRNDSGAETDAENGAEESKQQAGTQLPEPAIPHGGGAYDPSLTRVADDEPNVDTLTQIEACGGCHPDAVEQWRDSMHAWASFNNPMYRFAFEEFVDANGRDRGRHCAGCHDPAPLVAGDIDERIAASSPRAHLGVTCNTCHGVVDATTDGNGSYTLTTDEVPIPEEGNPASLEAHERRVGLDQVDANKMCVSCHRGFLSPATGHDVFIFGFDEYKPWRRSGWNGNRVTRIDESVPNRNCIDCHMPEDDQGRASHRFPGGHTAMADMLDAETQKRRLADMLDGAATVDVAAAGVGDQRFPSAPGEFDLEPGDRFWFDVVVRNVGGGHRLPGGQRDLRDTWLEVVVESRDGRVLAEAGRDHRRTGEDPSAHRLRKLVLSEEAEKERTHAIAHFRTKAFDRTVAPRDAELTRYAWQLPDSVETDDFPLEVEARLQHRRLTKQFQEATCEAAHTERGRAFLEGAEKVHGRRPDPCDDPPVVAMASGHARIHLDRFEPQSDKPAWKRWFERGLAMQSHLSERLDEALASFDRATSALDDADLPSTERDHRRAMILVGRAQVLARQRRHRKAIESFDRAEELVGDHPAICVGRGDAYANVWKYEEAVEQYRRASDMVQGDRVWRRLAIGLGSLGRYEASLRAARKGLAIEPRQSDLLRAQMIALRHLDVPEAWRRSASEAFDRFERDTKADRLRAECSDRSEVCQLERLPIHTHELEDVGSEPP